MKTSFFLYLIPSERHDTALVTVDGTRDLPVSSLLPCCVMYLWGRAVRVSDNQGPLRGRSLPVTGTFSYSLLQDLAVCGLRKTEVHELVQQLVHNDKVITDALLLQLLKILTEDLGVGSQGAHSASKVVWTTYLLCAWAANRDRLSPMEQFNEEK